MARPALPSFPPDTAASWEGVRRYAVPRSMIERVAERRAAGDWRGACAAGNVDVVFDPAQVAGEHGAAVARELEEDLRHLAPDLLRWHLPRVGNGRTTLMSDRVVTLASYGEAGQETRPVLHVVTPGMVDGPQRLTLRFGPLQEPPRDGDRQEWSGLRCLWDVRQAHRLREWFGGGDRIPFFRSDGTPLAAAELPDADPGPDADPAARTEWIILLHDRGDLDAAFAAVGMKLDPDVSGLPNWAPQDPLALLARLPLALTRWRPWLRDLTGRGLGPDFHIPIDWWGALRLHYSGSAPMALRLGDNANAARKGGAGLKEESRLSEASWSRPPDLDLLRLGRITPDDLHPLVHDALFPDRAGTAAGPPAPEPPAPVRVRCRGEWHELRLGGDGLRALSHTEDEQRRERALRAFGGPVTGCFAVGQTWTGSEGRLPRGLRAQRRELLQRMQHGDVEGVLALLDAGFDPRVRDGRRRTLLHHLNLIDHTELLPRLLDAGLDLEAGDQTGRTPLHVAVGGLGTPALVEALLAAGARVDVVDDEEQSLIDLIHRYKRRHDLGALLERLLRDHPDLDNGWGEWYDE